MSANTLKDPARPYRYRTMQQALRQLSMMVLLH
jgi:hypothetical protein